MAEPSTALGRIWGIAEQTWPVRMGKGILSGLTAPHDAWMGEMKPEEVYDRAAELGSLIMGGGMPMAATKTLASRSAKLYNSPLKPAHPFAEDYPSGALADDIGRLLKDIEGRDLTAKYVVGRRVVGGHDEAFPPAQFNALAEETTGRVPAVLPPRQMGQDTGRVVSEPIREVWIHDEGLAARRLSMMRIMARRTNAATVVA